jgi:hypothetical protein
MRVLRGLILLPISLGITTLATADESLRPAGHESHSAPVRSSPLVEKVRQATRRYRDVNVAIAEEWVQGTPCVSGPNEGAMGVHYVLPARVGDGEVKADEPEALIYEPMPGGALRLVGVEFIVLASDWAARHPGGGTPSLDGHLMHYVGEPNRYGLPAFYEIHVWAWEGNPKGSFADWNTRVTCDKQPAE